MIRATLLLLAAALFSSCGIITSPQRSLKEANMVEGPVIIQRGENYYLRLRRGLEPGKTFPFIFPMDYKESGGAGYFFFTGAISISEQGEVNEISLGRRKGRKELAKAGKIFWLNPDGSTQKLAIRKES